MDNVENNEVIDEVIDMDDNEVIDNVVKPKLDSKLVQQTPEYYFSLLAGAHDDLASTSVCRLPKGGEMYLYRYDDFRQIDHTYMVMPEERLKKCFRSDGYRWANCSGVHKLANTSMKKEYTGIWKEGTKKLNKAFTRTIYSHADHPRVVVHYIGDSDEAERALELSFHGNSLSENPNRYNMTSPAVLDKAKDEFEKGKVPLVVYKAKVNSGSSAFRNNKQVQNLKADHTRKMEARRDWVLNLFLMKDTLTYRGHKETFFNNFQVPELWLPMIAHPLVKEMGRSATETEKPIILHYDTQFKIGDYYLSSFCFRNLIFQKDPIVPVMFIAHDRKLKPDHERAASIIFEKCPKNVKNIIVVTDMEFSFEHLDSRVKHLYCWKHVNDAIERHLKGMQANGVPEIMDLFYTLKRTDKEDEFDKTWRTQKEEEHLLISQPKVVEYMEKQVTRWKAHCSIWLLREIEYPSPHKGCYNNGGESLNNLIKRLSDKEMPPDVLVAVLHYFAVYYVNETMRGRRKDGQFKMKAEFNYLAQSFATMPEPEMTPSSEDIIQYCMGEVNKIDRSPYKKDKTSLNAVAMGSICSDNVVMLEGGRVVVQEGEKSFVVKISQDGRGKVHLKCTCNFACMHLLTARKYVNLDDNVDNRINAGKMLKRQRIAAKEAMSGRKRPRPKDTLPSKTVRVKKIPAQHQGEMDLDANMEQVIELSDHDMAMDDLEQIDRDYLGTDEPEQAEGSFASFGFGRMFNSDDEENMDDIMVDPVQDQIEDIFEEDVIAEQNSEWITQLLSEVQDKQTADSFNLHSHVVTPTFVTPVLDQEEYRDKLVIIADPNGNIGVVSLADENTVIMFTAAADTACLAYMAAFMANSNSNAKKITVKEIGTQKAEAGGDQYGLVGAMILTLCVKEDPRLLNYDMTQGTALDIFSSRQNQQARHDGSRKHAFDRYCCCNKPWTNGLDEELTELLRIPYMVQCSKKECSRWYYAPCVDYNNADTSDTFHCPACTAPFNVPVRRNSLATNTCSIDCILALLTSHYSIHPEFVTYFDSNKEFSRLLRCSIQLIHKGYGLLGKEYILPAIIKERGIAEGTYADLLASEDSNYLNKMKNDGGFKRTHISSCSNSECSNPIKTTHSTTLRLRSLPKGETWIETLKQIVTPTETESQCAKMTTKDRKCTGTRKTTTHFTKTPWFLPFEALHSSITPKDVLHMPQQIEIGTSQYRLAGCTLSLPEHFVSMINYNKKWFTYDDIAKPSLQDFKESKEEITYIYYFRHE